jgi:hypothetical protein
VSRNSTFFHSLLKCLLSGLISSANWNVTDYYVLLLDHSLFSFKWRQCFKICNRPVYIHVLHRHTHRQQQQRNWKKKLRVSNVLTAIYVINAHDLAENDLFRTCYGKMWIMRPFALSSYLRRRYCVDVVIYVLATVRIYIQTRSYGIETAVFIAKCSEKWN